jgi:hypothetical protein
VLPKRRFFLRRIIRRRINRVYDAPAKKIRPEENINAAKLCDEEFSGKKTSCEKFSDENYLNEKKIRTKNYPDREFSASRKKIE